MLSWQHRGIKVRYPPGPLNSCGRALCVLSETGSGGVGSGYSTIPPALPDPGGLYDGDDDGPNKAGHNAPPGGGVAGDEEGGGGLGLQRLLDSLAIEEGRYSSVETLINAGTGVGVRVHKALLRRIETLALAVQAATVLKDPHLIQTTVCAVYSAARPLLRSVMPKPVLLQCLTMCHQALQLLPSEAWNWATTRTFARVTYELSRSAAGGPADDTRLGVGAVPGAFAEGAYRQWLLLHAGPGTGPRGKLWAKFKASDLEVRHLFAGSSYLLDHAFLTLLCCCPHSMLQSRFNFFGLPGIGPWDTETIRPPHLAFLGRQPVYAVDVNVLENGIAQV